MVQLWFQLNRTAKCGVKNDPKSHCIANTPRNNDSLSRKTTAETQEVERLTVVRRKHMIFYPFFFTSLGLVWAFPAFGPLGPYQQKWVSTKSCTEEMRIIPTSSNQRVHLEILWAMKLAFRKIQFTNHSSKELKSNKLLFIICLITQ